MRPSAVTGPLPGSVAPRARPRTRHARDRKSTRLNSSHLGISYAVFCLKKKNTRRITFLSMPVVCHDRVDAVDHVQIVDDGHPDQVIGRLWHHSWHTVRLT